VIPAVWLSETFESGASMLVRELLVIAIRSGR